MTLALTPLVGLAFGGATLTEHDDLAVGEARVGCPVWGAAQLLANLELRLGLPKPRQASAVRAQQWSRRMAELEAAKPGRFYARSHALDSVGTATTVLGWRDELVTAGWNGEVVRGGGERLETLRELSTGAELAPGVADRLRRVEDELRASKASPLDALLLAEARSLWPGRWQRVFALLEEGGTSVRTVSASFEPSAGDTDLAQLQRLLRGEKKPSSRLRGDGSILFVTAETSWELADAIAALLRGWAEPSTVILRRGETRVLDHALVVQGLPSQGLDETSAWRPALQVLPLAIELAFEPRDPYRVLELLTLRGGPFHGTVGRELAAALAQAPGIGGPAWRAAKEAIATKTRADGRSDPEERLARRLAQIAAWLEDPGFDVTKPAPREGLLAVADRVRVWLQRRLAVVGKEAEETGDATLEAHAAILGTAFAQAQAFHEALSHELRAELELVDARLLLEQVTSGHTLALATERAGRIDAVASPYGLRRARDVVVWWHCVGGTELKPHPRPWRRSELEALRAAGIRLPDPAERLAADSESWHQVIFAARKRLVLAVPRWAVGELLEPHPICHEIAARFGAKQADMAPVTIDARELLAGKVKPLGAERVAAVTEYSPLALPEARKEWSVDPRLLGSATHHSATGLDALVGCPLRWVLGHRARFRAGALESIASGPLLNGNLGHRLVEELHAAGAFEKPRVLSDAIATTFDRLLKEEGAVLLRPGMTFELVQLREQLARSIERLAAVLVESKLTVVDVELAVETSWRSTTIVGRVDVLLRDQKGRDVVLDLKWGRTHYRKLLESGLATQLAVYAHARKAATKSSAMPPAAYFSLSKGQVLATHEGVFTGVDRIEGPPLSETWTQLERTAEAVEAALRNGRVPVTGVRQSLPLLETLGISKDDQPRHLSKPVENVCDYCEYGAICGKNWEALA